METPERIDARTLPLILAWFDQRGLGTMPPDVLPPVGWCVVDSAGVPLAAAWLYEPQGCPLVILDWLISRPGLPPKLARPALRAVLAACVAHATATGARRMFASVSNPVMLREARACGFDLVASACSHLIKPL